MKMKHPSQIASASPARAATRMRPRGFRSAAFSLVEVTLAIGVMGFAFVAIIGLVPVGLGNFRQTKNASVAAEVSARILSELQDTPFTQLVGTATAGQSWSMTRADGSTLRYFDDQGTETTSADPSIVYVVNICVLNAPLYVVPKTSIQSRNAALAAVTVQVACDPGNVPLAINSTTNLLTGKTTGGGSVQIFNFNTYIAKNS